MIILSVFQYIIGTLCNMVHSLFYMQACHSELKHHLPWLLSFYVVVKETRCFCYHCCFFKSFTDRRHGALELECWCSSMAEVLLIVKTVLFKSCCHPQIKIAKLIYSLVNRLRSVDLSNLFVVSQLNLHCLCHLHLQVQTLLQQMQDKFQTMSDQIIGRNILTNNFKCQQLISHRFD